MKKNERLQALRILIKLVELKLPLSHLLKANPDLTPLGREICFGVCRHYFRLQAIADCLLKKRPKELDVWLSLLMGLYQLHYLRTPDYAVVKETVALLDQLKKSWAKGLVNAVLRTFCREQATLLQQLANTPAFQDGHPSWFVQRIKHDWPNDWQHILTANDTHPPMTLRVNCAQETRSHYLQRLQVAGIEAQQQPHTQNGMTLTKPCAVQDLPGFSAGDISVQDGAAQMAASLLDLQPGLRVLDACCAPGGKTCHILEMEPNLLRCVALDVDAKRLERVQENLTRLHRHAEIVQGDGIAPNTWWDGQLFDRILLDAPCSATGVIRRHPDIKLLRTAAEVTLIAQLQRQLLEALWPLLAPNGRMVYSTCSILSEENEQQIAQFAKSHPNCELVTASHPWGIATGHGWQILPGQHNMDGFFYSVLRKNDNA